MSLQCDEAIEEMTRSQIIRLMALILGFWLCTIASLGVLLASPWFMTCHGSGLMTLWMFGTTFAGSLITSTVVLRGSVYVTLRIIESAVYKTKPSG